MDTLTRLGKNRVYAFSHQRRLLEDIKRRATMNLSFNEACHKAKSGLIVRRTSWDSDMGMVWENRGMGFMGHTHPYYKNQPKMPFSAYYPYVCEDGDFDATDWEVK